MSDNPYTASPRAPPRQVAAEMAARKISSAVVVENHEVVGIFTAVDGLRGLSLLLAQVGAALILSRSASGAAASSRPR